MSHPHIFMINPLLKIRLLLALRRVKKSATICLLTLHADIDSTYAGGTEGHVRHLRSLLLEKNHAVLVCSPSKKRKFILRGMLGSEVFFEGSFHRKQLRNIIALLATYVDRLHVHHTIGWPDSAVEALAKSAIPIKTVTAHDFWFLCPSINLLTGMERSFFCGVESDMSKCNDCLAKKWHHVDETIQDYRAGSLAFLQYFSAITMPSPSMLPYFEKAYGAMWSQIAPRVKVLPHYLGHLLSIQPVSTRAEPKGDTKERLCFIGALGEHKGAKIIIEAIPDLQKAGFEVEIFGVIHPNQHPNLDSIKITPYKNSQELMQLLSVKGAPDYLCYAPIWPETYLYTMYEGFMICPTAIPIVGPYGNPAQVCKESGIGPIMREGTSAALIEAAMLARQSRHEYYKKLVPFVKDLRDKISRRSYLDEYFEATAP